MIPHGPAPNPISRTSETANPRWRIGASQAAGTTAAIVLAGVALWLSRVELALLALPLIAACAWNWDRRPDRTSTTTMTADLSGEPGAPELECALSVSCPDRVDSVSLRVATLDTEPQEIQLRPQALRHFVVRAAVLHSGPQEFFRIDYRLFGADASTGTAPLGPLTVRRVIAPPHTAIASLPLPRRLPGVTGSHPSARPGDGGDFRDIHSFTAGDRLRRIDWKVTARRGQFPGDLYVRRTMATADTTVFLVVDSRDDIGEQISEWSRNRSTAKGISSLDLAREAASAIAASYIRAGDRVGFQDLANSNRAVAPGGGNRHLWRLLSSVELTAPTGVRLQRLRPPAVTSSALIYVISSFLDGEAGRMATLWIGSGHRVIAVDVMPAALLGHTTRYDRLAHRLLMMQRVDRLRTLETYGIELLRWPEDDPSASREARLRVLSQPKHGRP